MAADEPSDNGRDSLLRAYWRELSYLRRMGAAFAEAHPKVAARLELGTDHSPDPHVERLIESFAFLTARIQHNLDSQYPEIASELLNLVHPHYLNPIPSMAVARFDVDPVRGKLTGGHLIPRHTPLFAHAHEEGRVEQGQVCRFRTAYPVTLWPVEVTYAGFESVSQFDFAGTAIDVLRLRIEVPKGYAGSLAGLGLDRLRFHLHGDRILVDDLYELLLAQCQRVVLLPEGDPERTPVHLPKGAIEAVGFARDEDVLPYPPFSFPAYRLVQEYFTWPEKFFFLDVAGLAAHGSDQSFDLLFLLDRRPRDRRRVDRHAFVLGCTPIVNLFPRTTDPIRLDHRRTEYPLVPDARRERTTEVHSILAVTGSSNPRARAKVYEPFYSFNHHMAERGHRAFWTARRETALRRGLSGTEPGTEMLLSLVDLDFRPYLPQTETIYAHTLCTNRRLAEHVQAGDPLQTEAVAPLARIVCLTKPTRQLDPPSDGSTLWRLISHLSLNYLSFESGEPALQALREVLKLYNSSDSPQSYRQIEGIREMTLEKVTERVGRDAWRGFCRGTQVTLTFDESYYVGGSAFLLGSVLNRFFALYASINSFTRLAIRSQQREGIWKKWPSMAGEQKVL